MRTPTSSGHFSQAFSYGLQNGLVCFAPAWFSILAVCLHTAPVENLRPPRTQAHLRRLGYEICEKWPLRTMRAAIFPVLVLL
ncbi:protein of unknown function [Methylacidimicrobium sp. AP8]|nr:protein of unknown function [Methylacidimicrobium sp. AP8]